MKEIKGNLLELFKEGRFDFIMHGCNCFSVMGAGIAKQIKDEFPQAFRADYKYEIDTPIDKLGMFSEVSFYGFGTIINAYTQYLPGSNFEYSALESCLHFLKLRCGERRFRKEHGLKRVKKPKLGLPLIGCGIGGGEFSTVKKILEKFTPYFDITIVHYDSGIEKVDRTEINFESKT